MEKYKGAVLVTGAFGGMGSKTVTALAESGYKVYALDRCVGEGSEAVIPIRCDITDERSVEDAFLEVRRTADDLCAIIHFAGIYMLDSLVEMDNEAFERIFKVNLQGAYLVNKIFLPLLKRPSRIIMTTSELAPLDPLPFTGIYAVTKGALDKYAYSLRMELQLLDIDVCVLRAGAVATEMLGVSTDHLERFCKETKLYSCNAERFKRIVDGVEARNIDPERIAERIIWILKKKRTVFSYSINRNPLLLMLNALPKRLQLGIIKKILE